MTLHEELKNKDKQEALSLCHDFRRMFGYIQDFSTTNNHIKVVIFDEGMIRIYQIDPRDILYIDCSGYLVSQIHNISRIFNYCIAIHHQISKLQLFQYSNVWHPHIIQSLFEVCWFISKAKKILFSEIMPNLN